MVKATKDPVLEREMRELLAESELYDPGHYLVALIIGDRIQIQYNSASSAHSRIGLTTRFCIDINGTETDIISFFVEKSKRRQGNGRKVYNIIEEFSKRRGCQRITTYGSGQGMDFWPKMGFTLRGETRMEKDIE